MSKQPCAEEKRGLPRLYVGVSEGRRESLMTRNESALVLGSGLIRSRKGVLKASAKQVQQVQQASRIRPSSTQATLRRTKAA
ncbi:hypothetical protein KCV07_g153, partial [Aureobasidium melanogenum]